MVMTRDNETGWHPPFCYAAIKGRQARRDGLALKANPYNEYDTCRGGPTFSLAFFRAWESGWLQEDAKVQSESLPKDANAVDNKTGAA